MKTYIVTGASRGLGASIAKHLAESSNAKVVLAVRDIHTAKASIAQTSANVIVKQLEMNHTSGSTWLVIATLDAQEIIMHWDAVGSIGEIIGAATVVVSVVYLAFQVKKQTEESKLAAARDLAAQFQTALDLLVQDKKLVDIWGRAVQNYMALSNDERLRIAIYMQRFTRVLEAQ
jgi:NAD(P)-dependent dehydrogenase (short-subunit alcohol dehydrogenase family)